MPPVVAEVRVLVVEVVPALLRCLTAVPLLPLGRPPAADDLATLRPAEEEEDPTLVALADCVCGQDTAVQFPGTLAGCVITAYA